MTPGPDAYPTGLATGDQREQGGGEDREKTDSRTQRESGSWSLKAPEGSRRQDTGQDSSQDGGGTAP